MAHPNPLARNVASLLGDELIVKLARESNFLVRQRSLQVVPFFWALVLGMTASPVKTLAGIQRLYHQLAGATLASSSFQERFGPALVAWLRVAFEHATATAAAEERRGLKGVLASFNELVLIDSTLLRLHDELAKRYPGPRTNHSPAAAKLNLVYNVVGGRIAIAKVAEGTRAETKLFKPGPWVAGSLLLFDLGYFKLQTFWRIVSCGGSFISRLKDNANPTITSVNTVHRGRAIDLAGKKLKDVLSSLKRQEVDCQVAYRVSRVGLPGRPAKDRKSEVMTLRLVAVLNELTGKYHLYVTNIGPNLLSARQIAEAYRLRWHVELLFKEMRSVIGLDEWPNRKDPVVLASIYASMLALLVNRRLLTCLRDKLDADQPADARSRISHQRWTAVFAAHALAILELLLGLRKQSHQQVKSFINMLLREAIEPSRRKPRLGARYAL